MLLGSPYFLSQLGSVFEYYKMIHNALLTAINYLLKGIKNKDLSINDNQDTNMYKRILI